MKQTLIIILCLWALLLICDTVAVLNAGQHTVLSLQMQGLGYIIVTVLTLVGFKEE